MISLNRTQRGVFVFSILMAGFFLAESAFAWDAMESKYYRETIAAEGKCDPKSSPYFCAPGYQEANKPGTLDLKHYRVWAFLATGGISVLFGDSGINEEFSLITEGVREETSTKPGANLLTTANPSNQGKFDAKLAEELHLILRDSQVGPYYQNTFEWYAEQIAFEKEHDSENSSFVQKLEKLESEWIKTEIAKLAYDANFFAEVTAAKAKRESAIQVKMFGGDNWAVAAVEYELENAAELSAAEAKKAAWVAENREKIDAGQRSNFQGAAKARYERLLATAKEYPYINPEQIWEMERQRAYFKKNAAEMAKDFVDDEMMIAVEIADGFREMKAVEGNPRINISADSTIAHDAYAVVPAPVWATVAALQFRNGVTINSDPRQAGQFKAGVSQATEYPRDSLFVYRREVATDRSEIWGPNTWLNESLKFESTRGSFVFDYNDAYAIVLRGNNEEGVDILFQFIGANCPTDATEGEGKGAPSVDDCFTPTHANTTIATVRPLGENRSLLKMNSRFVGQNYGDLKNKYTAVGFNWQDFFRGWAEFAQEAKEIHKTGTIKDRRDTFYYDGPMGEIPVLNLFE